jgi:hypothetical protein
VAPEPEQEQGKRLHKICFAYPIPQWEKLSVPVLLFILFFFLLQVSALFTYYG